VLEATVPLRTGPDSRMCLADVSWSTADSGDTVVSLRIRGLREKATVGLAISSWPDIIVESDKELYFSISSEGACTLL
jgi:hypothetical protein